MSRPCHTVLAGLILCCFSSPTRAQPPAGKLWLRVYSASRTRDAQRIRNLLAPEGLAGGRLRQVFLRRTRGPQGKTLHEVLTGPFPSSMDAVLHGLKLRRDPRFVKAGIRLRSLAVLLPTSFLPLPLRIDSKSLERMNPGRKRPFPVLGDLLVARAFGFSLPLHSLPALETSTARFTPWKPLLVLGEKQACNAAHTRCLRWFEVLHPMLIRTAWVPAYQLIPHRFLRNMTLPEGRTTTRARGAFWQVGRSAQGQIHQVMFRRGSMPPQLHVVVLDDRDKPPYRLVVDRHGPGIYNGEGNVVRRIKVRPWIYKRPPLWQIPETMKRGSPAPRRRAATAPATGRPSARPRLPVPRGRSPRRAAPPPRAGMRPRGMGRPGR
ncbi:MAG: hypothetical protein ABI333_30350 [bacterium]